MSNNQWRWADPDGQQRRVRLHELRAALDGGLIAPNTPVWRAGWQTWQTASEVPELTSVSEPPASLGAANIPPPPMAMLAVQEAFESKAGDSFSPSALATPSEIPEEEPPAPPHFVPLPARVSLPSPLSARESNLEAPRFSNLPTTVGLPPPPGLLALASASTPGPASGVAEAASTPSVVEDAHEPTPASAPMTDVLSGSMLIEDIASVALPVASSGALPPPTAPVLRGPSGPTSHDAHDAHDARDDEFAEGLPRRPQLTALFDDLAEIRAGRAPQNKLLVGVLAILTVAVLVSVLALVVSAIRGKPSETAPASSSPVAAAAFTNPNLQPALASSTTAPQGAVATPNEESKSPAGAFKDCQLAGSAHVVAPRAFVQAGVEVAVVPGALAVGFALDPRNGLGVTIDPSTIGITATVKARASGGDARRMTPVSEKGKFVLVPGVDKRSDRLLGRRVVGVSPAIDLGVADGSLVWAPHDQNGWAKLFSLEGDGVVDAVRAVPLGLRKGLAIAFRRGTSVYVGAVSGEAALIPEGALSRIEGLGQVGAPSVTMSGDTILVAWSDRASSQEPWQVRWTKLAVGGAPEPPKLLSLPDGGLGAQAMSPSVVGLSGGRFLMAWSEGTPTHQVRAMTINLDGTSSGAAMDLSAAGINAGQPQVAVGPDGRGVVAFLALKGKAYEVHATPVVCPAK